MNNVLKFIMLTKVKILERWEHQSLMYRGYMFFLARAKEVTLSTVHFYRIRNIANFIDEVFRDE